MILAIMKSFWFKNSTFTFCVWVLGQVDHCDENFWIVKYSKICSYFSSVTKWCNFKRLQDISIYVCLFADLKMSLASLTHNSSFLMRLYVYLPRYTQIRDKWGTMCPTLGLIGLTSMMCPWSQKMVLNRSRKSWP